MKVLKTLKDGLAVTGKRFKFFWLLVMSNDTEQVRQAEIEALGGGMTKPKK